MLTMCRNVHKQTKDLTVTRGPAVPLAAVLTVVVYQHTAAALNI